MEWVKDRIAYIDMLRH